MQINQYKNSKKKKKKKKKTREKKATKTTDFFSQIIKYGLLKLLNRVLYIIMKIIYRTILGNMMHHKHVNQSI
jgi:O-antigen/teichoic acid export membrane protein